MTLSGLPGRSANRIFGALLTLSPPSLRFGAATSLFAALRAKAGGEGGIRTPVGLSPKAVFKTAAIDHSATSP